MVVGLNHRSPMATTSHVLFPRWSNHLVRALLGVVGIGAGMLLVFAFAYFRSPLFTRQNEPINQPVEFDHRHHVRDHGIDCRFCHTTVETSANAGMPSTQTCLTCHSQLFRDEPMLHAVMVSAEQNKPLVWTQVATLPDHVHFNHSIHIAKGIACVSCHGDVTTMALTAKAHALTMRECIDCHRNPEPHQVAADEIFSTGLPRSPNHGAIVSPVSLPVIHSGPLTNCSTCHH